MRYDAVFLDFYGTLVEEDDAIIARIIRSIAEDSPQKPTPREVGDAWSFAEHCAAAHGDAFRPQRALELASLDALLRRFESSLSAEVLSVELFEYWRSPRRFSDADLFLRQLDLPVCLVSNIDREDLMAALEANGWRFEHIVTSECCCSYKPRAEMFYRAIERLKVSPERVLHVGDSWGSDVVGANRLGIPVAWLNRRNRARPDPRMRVAFESGDLTRLAAWIHYDAPHGLHTND